MFDLRFVIAGPEQIQEAMALRHRVYRRDVGDLRDDGLDERGVHFAAINRGGRMVATFRLVGPEHRPFDLEASVNLSLLLPEDARPALVGRLCVDPDFRSIRTSLEIHEGMRRLLAEYVSTAGISDLLLYTYRNLMGYYRGLGFRDTGITFAHPAWGSVSLMHAPSSSVRLRLKPKAARNR